MRNALVAVAAFAAISLSSTAMAQVETDQKPAEAEALEPTAGPSPAESLALEQILEQLALLSQRLEALEAMMGPQQELHAALEGIRAMAEADLDPAGIETTYDKGLRFKARDGSFSGSLSGSLQLDTTFGHFGRGLESDTVFDGATGLIPAGIGTFEDGIETRRLELGVKGTIHDELEYKVEFDFAGGDADFKDVYLQMKDFPEGHDLQFGQFKEPMYINELGSSKDLTFVEKGLAEALIPARSVGVAMHHKTEENMGWSVGLFKRDDDGFGADSGDADGDGSHAVTGRIFGAPVYADGGKNLVHIGASYSVRSPDDDTVRIQSRADAHDMSRIADTGSLTNVDHQTLKAIEFGTINGPLSFQAEAVESFNKRKDGAADATFKGKYVQGSYVLTGESRTYKPGAGVFGRVDVADPVLGADGGGSGAWEIAARYSTLDLTDGGVTGGELTEHTLGLNWYLDSAMRVMLNFVKVRKESVDSADIVVLRVERAF